MSFSDVIAVFFIALLALGFMAVKNILAIAQILIVLFVILTIIAIVQAPSDFAPFFVFLLLCGAVYMAFRYPVILLIPAIALLLYVLYIFKEDILGFLAILLFFSFLCAVVYVVYLIG